MRQRLRSLQGFIFDLDGTLMESSLDFVALKRAINCPPQTDILAFVDSLVEPFKREAQSIIQQHEMLDAEQAKWIKGAQNCIKRIQKQGLPLAIVTRNCRPATQLKLTQNSLQVPIIITREDGPPKPDPTTLLGVARQWGISVTQLAYVGDYLYDLQAANNAGMLGCLYAPDGLPHYAHLADWVFSDFLELEQLFD